MRFRQRYEAAVANDELQPDEAQARAVAALDAIATDLCRRQDSTPSAASGFARWFAPAQSEEVDGVRGLYLWGGVGRGKTFLCDLFYDSLPFEQKTRLHFHRFMQQIHADLNARPDTENPLELIAEEWAQRVCLLLLDEIHVYDITDAMLLGGLLTALFERGVTLVTTSNVAPDGLYRDGLQRARFLPAIAQIVRHTEVMELTGDYDYRSRLLEIAPIYVIGPVGNDQAGEASRAAMTAHFNRLITHCAHRSQTVHLSGRELPVLGRAGDVVWFDFDTLCNTARSTSDYIEIASIFKTVLLSNVPVMDQTMNDAARRFVNLIDELYDRHTNLIISAAAAPDALYTGNRLAFEFVRAASRLTEMRSRGSRGSDHAK